MACHLTPFSVLVARVPLELKLLLCKTTPLTVALGLEFTAIVMVVNGSGRCPPLRRMTPTLLQLTQPNVHSSTTTTLSRRLPHPLGPPISIADPSHRCLQQLSLAPSAPLLFALCLVKTLNGAN